MRTIAVTIAFLLSFSPFALAAKRHSKKAGVSHPRSRAARSKKTVTPSRRSAEANRPARVRKVSFTESETPITSRMRRHRREIVSPWKSPTFAESSVGDITDGEDMLVRKAAVQALGPYNGSVVVTDPLTGRILSMVNQKLALGAGYEPCSTIKVVASLAALSEGLIDGDRGVRVSRRHMDVTNALAFSNNYYFSNIGNKLGFEKVTEYARLFGLGEKAGLNIPGEQVSPLPTQPPDDGVGMMTSFGEGFYVTPLQLSAIFTAVANGGTLYYLQYPLSQKEADSLQPRVKRHLDIEKDLPAIRPGMQGAVEFGTAQRAQFDPDQPIFGKTGTCTDNRSPTHLGWFGSYQEVNGRKVVVVVLLTGGRAVNGPIASGIAGAVYRNLIDGGYYSQPKQLASPASLVSASNTTYAQ